MMEKITRRSMLAAVPAISMVPIVSATAEPAPVLTPRRRLDAALAELKAAAQEIDPNIERWDIGWAVDDSLTIGFSAMAFRRTGQYEGDGIYEGGSPAWHGSRVKYRVTLRSHPIDGHRAFDVCTDMDRMVLTEPRFNTFIVGGKVSAA